METVLLFVLGVLIVLVGLALSIGLHEIGHLVPAKLFGVKVTQYMIGFGKTLFSFRRGETEYGVKAIPLGGYISMIGMFPPAKGDEHGRNATTGFMQSMAQDGQVASMETVAVAEEERSFYKLRVWKRIVIMFGGPFMNLLIGVLLFGVLLMGFGTPQASTTVGSVSQCVLPSTSSRQTCQPSDPAGPAAGAGIKPGDKIISIDGTTIASWSQSTSIIRASANRTLSIVIERGGVKRTVAVTPKTNTVAKTDAKGVVLKDASGTVLTQSVGFVGIGTAQQLVPQPVTSVLPAVGAQVGAVTGVIINLPQRMVDVWNAAFGPGQRDPNGPMSIVGVGRVAGEVTALNGVPVVDKVYSILGLLASLNIALFVFNLIPLLPLDGGHIAGALWEGIRRTFAKLFKRRDPGPVDMAKLMPLTMAVVVVLGGMSLLLVYADIVKPVTIG